MEVLTSSLMVFEMWPLEVIRVRLGHEGRALTVGLVAL